MSTSATGWRRWGRSSRWPVAAEAVPLAAAHRSTKATTPAISMASAIATLGARSIGRRIVAHRHAGARPDRPLPPPSQSLWTRAIDSSSAGPLMKSLWDALPPTRRGGYAETAADSPRRPGRRARRRGDGEGSNGSKASVSPRPLRTRSRGDGLMFFWLYERWRTTSPCSMCCVQTFRGSAAIFTAQRWWRWARASSAGCGQTGGPADPRTASKHRRPALRRWAGYDPGGLIVGTLLWATSPASISGRWR